MNCDNCGDDGLRAGHVTKAFIVGGKPVVVEDIPALVCERCGDSTFDAGVAEQVRLLVQGPHKRAKVVQADVLRFHAA